VTIAADGWPHVAAAIQQAEAETAGLISITVVTGGDL
jgi:hypothetical protein